jgi:hypothetical protein
MVGVTKHARCFSSHHVRDVHSVVNELCVLFGLCGGEQSRESSLFCLCSMARTVAVMS